MTVPMEISHAIKKQYHAGFAMLRQAIERCPENLWTEGDHPRSFWRIAYHALFYTHLYLQTEESAFVRWERHRDDNASLFCEPWAPGAGPLPYTHQELLEYLRLCDHMVAQAGEGRD